MDDHELVVTIDRLVEEEHQLERGHTQNELSDADRARMAQIELQLDQCWDLLRQRRARRNVGKDPDEAQTRSSDVVEHYQQ